MSYKFYNIDYNHFFTLTKLLFIIWNRIILEKPAEPVKWIIKNITEDPYIPTELRVEK